jgi:multicomponent Na+:H+ antiporter subunit C
MTFLLAIVIGVLFTIGLYMMMRRSLTKVLIGLMLLSQAINLLIFTTGRLQRASPPLIPLGAEQITRSADPLPQALILTAIVISFGVTAFALVLARQTYTVLGTNDMNELRDTDIIPKYHPESVPEEEEGL